MSETTPLPLVEIKAKMELKGTVKRIELAGAFIDVGAETDALLHISQIKPTRVKNVRDYLEEGTEVTVWVQSVSPSTGHLAVTMIKPPAVSWNELAAGQTLTGTVIRVEKFGVFVDIGAERPGLVHVSELSTGYVKTPGEVVEKGQEIEVKVIAVDAAKKQIDLSIKALAVEEKPIAEVATEGGEEIPTAMALALKRALEGGGEPEQPAAKPRARRGKRRNEEREEILRRTLERLEQK